MLVPFEILFPLCEALVGIDRSLYTIYRALFKKLPDVFAPLNAGCS